jgi:hypothetical protein
VNGVIPTVEIWVRVDPAFRGRPSNPTRCDRDNQAGRELSDEVPRRDVRERAAISVTSTGTWGAPRSPESFRAYGRIGPSP